MKIIILLLAITASVLACTKEDVAYSSTEKIVNTTPYNVRFVFSRSTIIIIEGDNAQCQNIYSQTKRRFSGKNGLRNSEFMLHEELDSIIFDNKLYIDLSENSPHRGYYKKIENLNNKPWGFITEDSKRKIMAWELEITMDDYNKAIPIPGK